MTKSEQTRAQKRQADWDAAMAQHDTVWARRKAEAMQARDECEAYRIQARKFVESLGK